MRYTNGKEECESKFNIISYFKNEIKAQWCVAVFWDC